MEKILITQMCPERLAALDLSAFVEISKLMLINRHKLFDDEFITGEKPFTTRVYEIISEYAPYFWLFSLIPENKGFQTFLPPKTVGFCYLYDLTTVKSRIFSGFVSICFSKEVFGPRALSAAKTLLGQMFNGIVDHKIKAECYSTNNFAPNFLKKLGFYLEGHFKNEIIIDKTLVNTDIWGIVNPKSPYLQAIQA